MSAPSPAEPSSICSPLHAPTSHSGSLLGGANTIRRSRAIIVTQLWKAFTAVVTSRGVLGLESTRDGILNSSAAISIWLRSVDSKGAYGNADSITVDAFNKDVLKPPS